DADLRLVEARETVLDRCARLLGLERARDVPENHARLVGLAQGESREVTAAIRAFGQAWASLSGTHFGQIVKYLEKYDDFVNKHAPGYRIRFQAVSNTRSVSGASHEIPRRILHERREQPLLVALKHAARLARAA